MDMYFAEKDKMHKLSYMMFDGRIQYCLFIICILVLQIRISAQSYPTRYLMMETNVVNILY